MLILLDSPLREIATAEEGTAEGTAATGEATEGTPTDRTAATGAVTGATAGTDRTAAVATDLTAATEAATGDTLLVTPRAEGTPLDESTSRGTDPRRDDLKGMTTEVVDGRTTTDRVVGIRTNDGSEMTGR